MTAPTASPSFVLIDPAALQELDDSFGADAPGLLERIRESIGQLAAELAAAARAGNGVLVARIAHKLKSDCHYVGRAEVRQNLQKLESEAPHMRAGEVWAAVEPICAAMQVLTAELQGWQRSRAPRG